VSVCKNVWPMSRKTKLKQKPSKTNKNRRYEHHHDSYGSDCPAWCSACQREKRNETKEQTKEEVQAEMD